MHSVAGQATPSCIDNVKNGNETDKDCGGGVCPGCPDNQTCIAAGDCASGVCTGNICQAATCSDNVKNGNETDKDCGGGVCSVCVPGKQCNVPTDCSISMCMSNICQSCSLNSFTNGGFESRNANGWTLGGGTRQGVNSSKIVSNNYKPGGANYSATIATTHSAIVNSSYDPLIGSVMAKIVHAGNYAMRVEDLDVKYYVSVLSQQINNYLCTDIYFAWLAVLENGGHDAEDSSVMLITLKDVTVGDILLTRLYNAGSTGGGVDARFNQTGAYYYTPSWQIEHLPVNASRIGHSFELDVLAADCNLGGHKGYVYIDSFGGLAP